ncbi:SMP-30/gluconolactonase/LRE family protein [Vibrio sp. TH_r3]|uniref:SMP-30/gluconolactonase/LRE family protein n=1 Tax=Vibrio sp. TH_r3 TaxID=3082084 RepID=UPI0029554CC2|nr:SMP-30/gluconolactonase/LRE family protein [Vibrio sp. TH_r3]MDV7104959.1 SMP-30/gluconolactonase/LRE family protein [Vibrio sp. TH_r3]
MEAAKLLVDCKNTHGEGIVWCHQSQRLFWTDIEGCTLWTYSLQNQSYQTYEMPNRLCAFMIKEDGTLLAGFDQYVAIINLESNNIQKLFDFEPENPFSRLNDGKPDLNGNFVIGGVNESDDESYCSSVIKIDRDLSVHTLIKDVTCANSICFSPDGKTLYFSDTPKHNIIAYDYSPTCKTLPEGRVIFAGTDRFSFPDGSTVDQEGYIWNAVWGGSAVIRIDPNSGAIDRVVEVPVNNPTCVAIGGKDLNSLFITSSRQGLTEQELFDNPQSGGLFTISL